MHDGLTELLLGRSVTLQIIQGLASHSYTLGFTSMKGETLGIYEQNKIVITWAIQLTLYENM